MMAQKCMLWTPSEQLSNSILNRNNFMSNALRNLGSVRRFVLNLIMLAQNLFTY
jgi:hypothetical protein